MGLDHDTDAAQLRPAWVEIDLGALTRNLERLRGRVAGAGVLAVVKADAYGHGAVTVARASTFIESGQLNPSPTLGFFNQCVLATSRYPSAKLVSSAIDFL